MSFVAKLQRAREVLEQQGRLSLRALRRELDIDDEELDELIDELIEVQGLAVREGNVLVCVSRAGAVESANPASAHVDRRPTPPDPRAYTPKHLADKILQSKSALEGERKQVTVLFADVKGSMELAEQLDPEEWSQIMQRFFRILSDGVERFEGFVDKFTGDGIMALFGAPIAHEDHAQRACYAALHLRDALRDHAQELRRQHGLDFQVRMGINSGDVVVGKIGDDLRMEYTAQGHTVGLASRLENLAEPNTCYVSKSTAALAHGYFDLEELGAFRVKGVSDAVEAFRLCGVGPLHTRFQVAHARGLTRFVGRDADMRVLEDALAHARAGRGQVVGVVAEAGTGKSRLCFEFTERCRAQGVPVYQGNAVAHGKNIPYVPILDLFRAYFGITEQDADRGAREKIAGRLLLIDDNLKESLPLVFEFMGIPDPNRPAPQMDPEARQKRLYAVLQRVSALRAEAEVVVTLLEDLHWFDAASDGWLELMVNSSANTRTLLLVNFRPEYHAEWMRKSFYCQLPLAPLGPEAIRDLLADLLGADPSIEGLAERIHAQTAGNPFFTEEVVQGLIEAGHLEGERGAYRLVVPIERLEVPPTVQAVLAARIDRLDEREKHVLQTASVIGKEFTEPILRRVFSDTGADSRAHSGGARADVTDALRRLETAEFVYQTSLYPVAEYAFKHPLTQEVALGSQLRQRRERTHAAVARALEEAHAGTLDENAALLAHHYEAAGEAAAAAGWHLRAAQWLLRNDTLEAFVHLRRTRELGAPLREHREALGAAAQAINTMLINSWRVGMEPDEWEALAAQGRELAAWLEDRRLLLGIELGFTLVHSLCGYLSDAIEPSRRAVQLANELGDLESCALARERVAEIWWFGGQHTQALSAFEELEEMGRKNPSIGADRGLLPLRDWSVGRQGYVLCWMGRPEEAVQRIERAERGARQQGEFDMLSLLSSFRVEHAWFTGQTKNAVLHAQQALEFAERTGNPFTRVLGLSCLGLAHLCARQAREGREVLEKAVALCQQRRLLRQYFAFFLGSLAEAHLQAGDPERALAVAEEATAYGQRAGTLGYELRAELVVAGARTALGAHADAERSLARCDDLVGQTGSAALAPFITELRAWLAAARGEDPAELLRAARHQFESVGATGHVARLAQELSGAGADVSI